MLSFGKTSTWCLCTSSGDLLGPAPGKEICGEQGGIVAALLPDAGDQRVGGRVAQLVEPALERGSRRLGVEPGGADTFMAEEALQVGDVHSERQQPRGHGVPQQVRVDALGDPGRLGHGADDLADALPGQGVRHGAGPLLANSGPARRASM